jgi:predicted nucleotidyltransferase
MHVYAFGSICRGDISVDSDIDLLAIVDGPDSRFNPEIFSVYTYGRIKELWDDGNPFAWHLALESRLVFSADQTDYLQALNKPKQYRNCDRDCDKFFRLFQKSHHSIMSSKKNRVFELSTVFLSVRNFASCYSLGIGVQPNFSRRSALKLGTRNAPISGDVYQILERARILSTRGYGAQLTEEEIESTLQNLPHIDTWMAALLEESKSNE